MRVSRTTPQHSDHMPVSFWRGCKTAIGYERWRRPCWNPAPPAALEDHSRPHTTVAQQGEPTNTRRHGSREVASPSSWFLASDKAAVAQLVEHPTVDGAAFRFPVRVAGLFRRAREKSARARPRMGRTTLTHNGHIPSNLGNDTLARVAGCAAGEAPDDEFQSKASPRGPKP